MHFILFPGGGCKICGSVEHFRRDCPQLIQQNQGKKYLVNTNYTVVFLVMNMIPFDVRSHIDINIVLNVLLFMFALLCLAESFMLNTGICV